MENLEEDIAPTNAELAANLVGEEPTDFDDSVIILEPHIHLVDLTQQTSPLPSTSAASAGACGVLKPKIEEPSDSKGMLATDTSTTTTNDNPSTSSLLTSGLAGASSPTADATAAANLLECPICLQTCIHPAKLPCGHIFCFLCVKGVAYKNRRCAMCRREIPPEFLDHPQLVNGIEDICTTKATDDGYQWFYEGRNGWWQYDNRTSTDLEEAFKKGERSCTILVAGYVYIVDFETMIQQRQNEPARCRRVKRDLATIPKKGVAGLRIEGNTVTTDSNFAQQVYRQNRYHNDDLDLQETALLGGAHGPLDPNNPQGPLRLSYGLGGYVIELGNPSEFVSTSAATDAALRIASDIIGSTLAHADELTRSTTGAHNAINSSSSYQQPTSAADMTLNSATGELNLNDLALISQQQQQLAGTTTGASSTTATYNGPASTSALSSSSSLLSTSGHGVNLTRERGSRELLGAAEDLLGATQRVIATADQPTIDLFEETLNNFHALTLRNIVDSSDDDDGLHHNTFQQTQTPPTPPPNGQRSHQNHDNQQ